uniref:Uncharacterized protein n=1 Tax=Plectus sambesii TaxID=2011161 RepID=A0A914X392_9BILA
MRPFVLLLVLSAVTADWSPSPLFAMHFDGIHDRTINRTSDGRLLKLQGAYPQRPAPFLDQRPLGQAKVHLDKRKCRVTSQTGANKMLTDQYGSVLLYRQFVGRQSNNTICADDAREKRQIHSQVSQIEAANINVKSFDSNVSVAQLINITSGQSMISVNERYVTSALYSDASNVLIEPNNEFVNMTVIKPFTRLKIGDNSSQLDMTADRSDVFVRTNHSGDEHSYMMIQSGASNLSLMHGTGRLQALNAISSVVALNTWELNIEERLTIASNLSTADGLDRYLSVLLLTKLAHIQVTLVGALVRIRYGQADLEISPDYRTVTIFTGTHTVILNTVTSPFTILMTERELDIRVPKDDVVLSINPNTSNIVGRMGELSLMQIRPDANTTLRIGGSDGEPSALSGIAEAEIDVTSRNLGIEVVSSTNSIFAESNRSEALIKTNKTEVGIQARHARIDIVAGRPRILITTGNTTIEINSNAPNFGATLLPPYTTPANIFTNIGPFDGVVGGGTTPQGQTTRSTTRGSITTTENVRTTSTVNGTGTGSTITTETSGNEQTTTTSAGDGTTSSTESGTDGGSTSSSTASVTSAGNTDANSTSENGSPTTTSGSGLEISSTSSTGLSDTSTTTVEGSGPWTTTLYPFEFQQFNVTTAGIRNSTEAVTTTTATDLDSTITTSTITTSITATVEAGGSTTTTLPGALKHFLGVGGEEVFRTDNSEVEIDATVAAVQTPLASRLVERDTLLSGSENFINDTVSPFPTPLTPPSELLNGLSTTTLFPQPATLPSEFLINESSTISPFPTPLTPPAELLNGLSTSTPFPQPATLPSELLTNGSSTADTFPQPVSPPDELLNGLSTPLPQPFPLPIGRSGGLTPSPTEAPAALPLRRARMANPPPSVDYLLSVGVQVDKSLDSSTEQFLDTVVHGLHEGYIDGRRLQLGLKSRQPTRTKRQAAAQTRNETIEEVEIMVTSVDRTLPERVTTRFFVKSGEDLVLATNAAETFNKVTNEKLSALMAYEVVEPVKPVTVTAAPMSGGLSFVTMLILVVIAALLLIVVATIVLCYKAQKRQVSLTKRILQWYPQRSARRTSPILPPVPESVRERANSRHTIIDNMEGGYIVQSEDERTESPASSVAPRLAFIEYPTPLDSADGHLLLRQLSAKDRIRVSAGVDSPRSIVLPEPNANFANRRLPIAAAHSRKVGSTPSPIPINNPEAWTDDPNAISLGDVPSARNLKANLFRVSVEKSSSERRATARRLLDTAFPLTTVDIERFIESK